MSILHFFEFFPVCLSFSDRTPKGIVYGAFGYIILLSTPNNGYRHTFRSLERDKLEKIRFCTFFGILPNFRNFTSRTHKGTSYGNFDCSIVSGIPNDGYRHTFTLQAATDKKLFHFLWFSALPEKTHFSKYLKNDEK